MSVAFYSFGRRLFLENVSSRSLQQGRNYICESIPAVQRALFATKTTATHPKLNITDTTPGAYWNSKRAAKDRRRELYDARQERKERLKVRRAGRPRLFYRKQFRSFFIPKKVNDEYMHRKARQAGMDWEYRVATILERIPVVTPDLEKWETEYEELKDKLSQFGKEFPKEFVGDMYEKHPRGLSREELIAMLPFDPAPRETEADSSGDVKTTNRKLKTRVYLVVREDDHWQFPTVPLGEDSTLIEAAKRALKVKVGSAIDYWCPSYAPWSVDLQAFPAEKQKESGLYGVKTFFVKVQLDEVMGELSTSKIQDFAWLDREEIVERIQGEQGDKTSQFYHYML